MREIKFRGWNVNAKRMDDNVLIDNGRILHLEYGNICGSYRREDFIPMQYTGLKDNNGKEIYEGDIVKISDHPFQGSIDIDGNYEVGFNDLMELSCGGWYLHRMRHWAEVIGNIYENPELLKN